MPQRALVPSLLHARTVIETWCLECNEERPKKALGGLTPAAYARQLAEMSYPGTGLYTVLLLNSGGRRSTSCRFHSVIWFGCSSYCLASSTIVLSSRSAARATFALSVAECARRVLLTMRYAFLPTFRPSFVRGDPTYTRV